MGSGGVGHRPQWGSVPSRPYPGSLGGLPASRLWLIDYIITASYSPVPPIYLRGSFSCPCLPRGYVIHTRRAYSPRYVGAHPRPVLLALTESQERSLRVATLSRATARFLWESLMSSTSRFRRTQSFQRTEEPRCPLSTKAWLWLCLYHLIFSALVRSHQSSSPVASASCVPRG